MPSQGMVYPLWPHARRRLFFFSRGSDPRGAVGKGRVEWIDEFGRLCVQTVRQDVLICYGNLQSSLVKQDLSNTEYELSLIHFPLGTWTPRGQATRRIKLDGASLVRRGGPRSSYRALPSSMLCQTAAHFLGGGCAFLKL